MTQRRSGATLGFLILLLMLLTVFPDAVGKSEAEPGGVPAREVQARKVYRQEGDGLFLHFYENGECVAVVRLADGDQVSGGFPPEAGEGSVWR